MRTIVKKSLALVLSGILSVGIFAGCGSSQKPSDQGQQGETKTLYVTMGLAENEWEVMRKDILPEFEKQNNVKVEAVQVEAKDVITKLQAMKDAGKMEIDVIAQDVNNTSQLIAKGLVEDLSSYASMIPAESIGKLVDSGKLGDKTYFFPYRPNVEINLYNENYFNKYNLETPKTWDELLETAKTLKEKEGIGRLLLKFKMDGDAIEAVEFIRQGGGDPLVLNDEGSIKAFTFLKELWPYLSPDTQKASYSTTNDFLSQESVYYAPNWPFAVNIIVKDNGKEEIKAYAGYEGPAGKAKVLGGEVLGIPAGTPNKDLALKFIEYMMSKEVQQKLVTKLGWASFRSDCYGDVEDWQEPYFKVVQEAMEVAQPMPNVAYWPEANKAINDAMKEIVLDGKDVKETLDKYHEVIEQAKAKYAK